MKMHDGVNRVDIRLCRSPRHCESDGTTLNPYGKQREASSELAHDVVTTPIILVYAGKKSNSFVYVGD